MKPDQFDIAIIGGGIHGVGIAQAAAAAGYRTVLLEKTALAAGTSSRSSKLIHGGLRYLESAQISLVRKSLQERSLLLKLAPELVRPVPFYIPIYRHTRRRPWQIRIGLFLYSLLGGRGPMMRFHTIPESQWSGLEGLNTQNLQAVFCYSDAQTDDTALTEAVMRSAQVLGATLLCPADFIGAEKTSNGYTLTTRINNDKRILHCRYLVNAAGPWANRVLEAIKPTAGGLDIELVQGAHIIIEGSMHDKVFYLEAPRDGRAVFVMPWKNDSTLIGTTEHLFTGDPADVKPLADEINYLLETVHHYFPEHSDRVVDSFAGLRVLPKTKHEAFHRPRETILHGSPDHPRLLTIYGGKLTAYRSTAESVIDIIASVIGNRKRKMRTDEIYLTRINTGTGSETGNEP